MTEHDPSGPMTTLLSIGCLDCGTEEGMAFGCCTGARCDACDHKHRGEALDAPRRAPDMLQFEDGPLKGRRFVAQEWPPPEEIPICLLSPAYDGPDGAYVRQSFSQLPADHSPHLIRGGLYQWREFA